MRIGELAERTGVTTPTLRFYEEIGLLSPVERTTSGYRRYDAGAEARLRFIARAKGLGLSLEEIKELLDICAGEGCAASEVRLAHVLAHKIEVVRSQVSELQDLGRQLESAHARLTGRGIVPLGRELAVIGQSECSCGAACDAGSRSTPCACCPWEEVSDA